MLSSYYDCNKCTGWLEPLLDRIARSTSTVPTPVIDVIDDETLEFFYQDSTLSVGGFDWSLQVAFQRPAF